MAVKRSTKKQSPTAPHLVEPQLKYVTDATFTEFHEAIARGFQEPPHVELTDLDRRVFDNEADVRLQGRPTLGLDLRRLRAPA